MGLLDRFRPRGRGDAEAQRRIAAQPAPYLHEPGVTPQQRQLTDIRAALDVDALTARYSATPASDRALFLDDFIAETRDARPEAIQSLRQQIEDWLRVLDTDDDPVHALVAAALLRTLGWTYRRYGKITTVGETDVETYWALNTDALDRLTKLAGTFLDGGDVTPLVWIQRSTDGWSNDEKLRLAEQWRAVDPWHRLGLAALQRQIDERWGGGDWAWFELAHHIAREAPDGEPALGLVPYAAVLRWGYLVYFADTTFDDADLASLKLPQVQSILRLAYDKLIRSGSGSQDPDQLIHDLNHFMWACYYGDVDDIALDAMKRLDGAVSPEVWGSLRELDPIEEFTHARDYLLREVDRP